MPESPDAAADAPAPTGGPGPAGGPGPPKPAALLLTGGSSQRMGATKATLIVGGEPLAERTASLLRLAADPVFEVGPGFTTLTHTREEPPGAGPLAALAAGGSALRRAGHRGPALLVATDLPRLTVPFLKLLAAFPAPDDDHSVVPRDRSGRAQGVCARYSAVALARAAELVGAGQRSLTALLDAIPVTWLDVDGAGEAVLLDLDTPADLAALNSGTSPQPMARPHLGIVKVPETSASSVPETSATSSVPETSATSSVQETSATAVSGLAAGEEIRRPTSPRRVVAVRPSRHLEQPDTLATEEPMEIRLAGPGQTPVPVAVTMRTPGHDFDLAVGFLFSEGIIDRGRDVVAVRYCDLPPDGRQRFNIVTVDLRRPRPDLAARSFAVSASCGVCGKASIEDLHVACPSPPVADDRDSVPVSFLLSLPERLRAGQTLFDRTGGTHGAGLAGRADRHAPLVVREDVGRHNAVDKLVGRALLAGQLPLRDQVLVVSGRVSFEIVQKAARAGIAVLVAVSAPSSLAVDAAQSLGLTIAAFMRGERCNVYSHPERIDLDA